MTELDFRTTTLTILGAVGYLTSLVLVVLKASGVPISWNLIGYTGLTASLLLNIDLAIDLVGGALSIQIRRADGDDQDNDDDQDTQPDTQPDTQSKSMNDTPKKADSDGSGD